MVTCLCRNCGKIIIDKKHKDRKFCCKKCFSDYYSGERCKSYKHGESRGSVGNCKLCGKDFIRTGNHQRFCSKSCGLKFRWKNAPKEEIDKILKKSKDIRNKNFMRKFINSPKIYKHKTGYLMINLPQTKGIKYHRYLWEKENGRIPEGYVIHHINGIKTDNRLDNLQLMEAGAHSKLHNDQRTDKQDR
jgi:endogenous inhibitor of DNA gyrase (YacG/DUF329 family)